MASLIVRRAKRHVDQVLCGVNQVIRSVREPLRDDSKFAGEALAVGEHPVLHSPDRYPQAYPRCDLSSLEETIDQLGRTRSILVQVVKDQPVERGSGTVQLGIR